MEVTQEIPLLKAAIFNHQEATAGVGFLGGRSTAKKIGMRSASKRHHRRAQVAVAVAIVPQRLLIWIWIVSHRHSGDSKAADFSKKTRGSNSPFRRTLTLCVCVCVSKTQTLRPETISCAQESGNTKKGEENRKGRELISHNVRKKTSTYTKT